MGPLLAMVPPLEQKDQEKFNKHLGKLIEREVEWDFGKIGIGKN